MGHYSYWRFLQLTYGYVPVQVGRFHLLMTTTNKLAHILAYRVTGQGGKNLPLTEFQQFWQLVDRYYSYLLPRQDGGTFQI